MKGLLYKEYCMFKSQYKSWLLAIFIISIYGIVLKDFNILFTMTALMGVMSSLSTFTFDRMYHCDEYIVSMPVSRRTVVSSKYLFLLLLDLGICLLCLAIAIAGSLISGGAVANLIVSAFSVLCVTILLQAIFIPAVYFAGPEKARLVIVLIGMLPFLLISLFKDQLPSISEAQIISLLKLSPAAILILVILSVNLSIAIFKRKEF